MDALVKKYAAAGSSDIPTPGTFLVIGLRASPCHLPPDGNPLAVFSAFQQTFQMDKTGIVPVLKAQAEHLGRVFFLQFNKASGVFKAIRQGFFAQDMTPLFRAVSRYWIMQIVGQTDVHTIGLFLREHLLVIGIKGDAGRFCPLFLLYVAHPTDFHLLQQLQLLKMNVKNGTHTNNRRSYHPTLTFLLALHPRSVCFSV